MTQRYRAAALGLAAAALLYMATRLVLKHYFPPDT